jgi:hypothetical protein
MSTRTRGFKLEVVAPCSEDWDKMSGGDDIRFCGKCRQNVYNLSELTESQARELVQGPVCVRFFHRGDGTVITRKCSPMMEAARRRLVALAAGVAGVLPLAAGFWGSVAWLRKLVAKSDRVVMGGMRPTPPPRPTMGEPIEVRGKPLMGTPPPSGWGIPPEAPHPKVKKTKIERAPTLMGRRKH